MKKIIFLLIFLLSTSIWFAESSEDSYTIKQACNLSPGNHMGRITSLEKNSQFQQNITNNEYVMGSFYIKYLPWKGNWLAFAANNISGITHDWDWSISTETQHAELFWILCNNIWTSIGAWHAEIRRFYKGSQYHPAVATIYQEQNVLLEDYESINGKSYHISRILPSASNMFVTITNDNLQSIQVIKNFIKSQQFFWTIKDYKELVNKNWYTTKTITVEIRLSRTIKRNFTIKI